MPLKVNLSELELRDLTLKGEIPLVELDLDDRDPMVQATQPLRYAIEVQQLGGSLLLTGSMEMELNCKCVRCLKPFKHHLRLAGPFLELPLEGEEALPVEADAVDLTPPVRELILLEFPPQPVCQPDCGGLSIGARRKSRAPDWIRPESGHGSPWDQLDNLNL